MGFYDVLFRKTYVFVQKYFYQILILSCFGLIFVYLKENFSPVFQIMILATGFFIFFHWKPKFLTESRTYDYYCIALDGEENLITLFYYSSFIIYILGLLVYIFA